MQGIRFATQAFNGHTMNRLDGRQGYHVRESDAHVVHSTGIVSTRTSAHRERSRRVWPRKGNSRRSL